MYSFSFSDIINLGSVQFSSVTQSGPTLRSHGLQHARFPCPSPTWSLLKFMSIESVMPSSHLILCCSLLLLPSIFPSIRVFSNVSVLCIRWPNYWSFSFTICPSNEYFREDWFDLLAVQGTLKSFSNITVQKHQFFGPQLSLWSNSPIHTWLLENHIFDWMDPFQQSNFSAS